MAATEAVPREGALIGRSTFPGNERLIALSPRYRAQHLDIMGSTGSGKTTLMANLAAYDMEAGHGGKSGRFERFKSIAEYYAFMLDQLGIRS